MLAGEADELLGASDDGAALGAAGDRDPASPPELEQPLIPEEAQRAKDGVGVDLEHGSEVAGGWQPLTGLRFAVGDRTPDLGGNLLVQLGRLVAVDLDTDHGASNSSSIMPPVLLPPRFTGMEHETELLVDLEALIEEARQRQRRRRRRMAAAVAVTLVGGALAFGIVRLVSAGSARVAAETPKGLFVNRSGFAGHGLLAFVSRGRLFVLDGRRRRLTPVTAPGVQASGPRFSPDGEWLVYAVGARANTLGLARSDGSSARVISRYGGANWLPDGDLLIGRRLFRVDPHGRVVRVGTAPADLVAWSPSGDRFAFVSRTIVKGRNGAFHGVERLEIADSLDGKRTIWRRTPFSFTRLGGFRGNVNGGVVVLPRREGVLYWVDPDQSNSYAADGLSLYALRAPMAKPITLAVTVGDTVSVGPGGRLAIGAGGNRYAWITKNVVTCNAASARCRNIVTPPGLLAIDPAWSPDGKTLAFVQASARPEGDFFQATIARWYATHTLWLLRAGATHATKVADTQGAAAPAWSSNGGSILYVAGDALWLIPRIGAKPEKIAGPLYPPNSWPSYYGQVGWSSQFAWASP